MSYDLLEEGTAFITTKEQLTKREVFALHLYQAMLANNRFWDGNSGNWNIMAQDAISAADALLEELADG